MKTRFFAIQVLIALLALASTATALRWAVVLPRQLLEKSLEAQVGDFVAGFIAKTPAVLKLRWEDLRRLRADSILVDPKSALPESEASGDANIREIYAYAKTCHHPPLHLSRNDAYTKLLTWSRFACGEDVHLTPDFFAAPPYLHPSGRSYAALFLRQDQAQSILISEQRQKFKAWTHVMELNDLPPFMHKTSIEEVLATLQLDQWKVIQYRSLLANGPTHVLIAEGQDNNLYYGVYKTMAFTQAIDSTYLQMDTAGGDGYYRGNSRWNFAQTKLQRHRYVAIFCGIIGSMVLLGQIIWLLLRVRRIRREELQRRTFSLQLLTHEIRTPAAALKLNLGTLQDFYDHLPSDGQISLLQALSAEARMDRVLHASQTYLQSGDSTLRMQAEPCESFHDYLAALVQDYEESATLEAPATETRFSFDKHWLGFCLRNLIENALKHGRAPVRLRWWSDRDHVYIDVCDEGQFTTQDYRRLSKPFVKHARSDGLGLGLAIVKRILEAMGGQLNFKPNPTTFTLKLRRSTV